MLANHESTTNTFSLGILRSLKDEISYGGYIPAMVGPSLVLTTAIITGANLSLAIILISYIIPLMVYSFDYYQDMDTDEDTNLERAKHYQKRKKIYPYILGSYLVVLFLLLIFFTNWLMFSFIIGLMLMGLLYPLGLKRLTSIIPAFKNMYTIGIWAVAGTLSAAFFNQLSLDLSYLLIFFFFFLKMIPNTIFFDLKDIKSDTLESLKTIPVILGKSKTVKLLYLVNTAAFAPLLLGIYLNLFPFYAGLLTIFLLYSLLYLYKTSKLEGDDIKMKYFLISDIEFIMWPLLIFSCKLVFF